EKEEGGLGPSRGYERGKGKCGNESAGRDRRLANAQRKASLAGREPEHDGAPAGRVHTGAGCSCESEQREQEGEACGEASSDETGSRREQAKRENEAFPVAVGREAPGKQRQKRTEPRGGEEGADFTEREPELLAQLRRDDGQPDRER